MSAFLMIETYWWLKRDVVIFIIDPLTWTCRWDDLDLCPFDFERAGGMITWPWSLILWPWLCRLNGYLWLFDLGRAGGIVTWPWCDLERADGMVIACGQRRRGSVRADWVWESRSWISHVDILHSTRCWWADACPWTLSQSLPQTMSVFMSFFILWKSLFTIIIISQCLYHVYRKNTSLVISQGHLGSAAYLR